MKKISKDIAFTLGFKLILLILLWVVCFRGIEKNPVDLAQWLFGSTQEIQ